MFDDIEVVNDDGTPYKPPKNPLPTMDCIGYTCMFCGRCPNGDYWICPEEYKEVYNKWLHDLEEYHKEHSPSMIQLIGR